MLRIATWNMDYWRRNELLRQKAWDYLDSSKNFLANGTDIGKYAVLDKLTIPPTNLFFFQFSNRVYFEVI